MKTSTAATSSSQATQTPKRVMQAVYQADPDNGAGKFVFDSAPPSRQLLNDTATECGVRPSTPKSRTHLGSGLCKYLLRSPYSAITRIILPSRRRTPTAKYLTKPSSSESLSNKRRDTSSTVGSPARARAGLPASAASTPCLAVTNIEERGVQTAESSLQPRFFMSPNTDRPEDARIRCSDDDNPQRFDVIGAAQLVLERPEAPWDFCIRKLLLDGRSLPNSASVAPIDLDCETVAALISEATRVLEREPTLLEIEAPLRVVGDLRGHFQDLICYFSDVGFPVTDQWLRKYPSLRFRHAGLESAKFLFLGGFTSDGTSDRHSNLKTLCLLLALKVAFADQVFLIRGCEEALPGSTLSKTLFDEIAAFSANELQTESLAYAVIKLYERLPLAAKVGGRVLCIHAGHRWPRLMDLAEYKRPIAVDHCSRSDKTKDLLGLLGLDSEFRVENALHWMAEDQLTGLIRSHECIHSGLKIVADGHVVTIMSAFNINNTGNIGVILTVQADMSISISRFIPKHHLPGPPQAAPPADLSSYDNSYLPPCSSELDYETDLQIFPIQPDQHQRQNTPQPQYPIVVERDVRESDLDTDGISSDIDIVAGLPFMAVTAAGSRPVMSWDPIHESDLGIEFDASPVKTSAILIDHSMSGEILFDAPPIEVLRPLRMSPVPNTDKQVATYESGIEVARKVVTSDHQRHSDGR